MNSRKTNRIGIAVVEHQRQFLIGIRPAGVALAGFHEFPGGKMPERGVGKRLCCEGVQGRDRPGGDCAR